MAKPVDAQIQQTQKLNSYYLELGSLPTDPIELIRTKYIFTKKKVGNRRLYMPNVPPTPPRNATTCADWTR